MNAAQLLRHWRSGPRRLLMPYVPRGQLYLAGLLLPRLGLRLAGLRRRFGFPALVTVLAVAAFAAGPWFGERPSPTAVSAVIDGGTLRAGDIAIRLAGIDAPELGQTCRDARGDEWRCGRVVRNHLRSLVARGQVACINRGFGYHGRTVAACSAGDVRDLSEAMVRAGYAMSDDRFTRRYAAAEAQARAQRRGLWRGMFQRPEHWRARHRARQTVGWSGR